MPHPPLLVLCAWQSEGAGRPYRLHVLWQEVRLHVLL